MNHTLEFDSLFLEFGLRKILSGIYMKCETGQLIGLLGRNGSGKSSLMQMVFGTLQGENQSIRVDGRHLSGSYLRHQFIGYLPQENFVPPGLHISRALEFYGIHPKELTAGFPEFADKMNAKSEVLSTGQLRLLETLLILKGPHWFCLLDEPFTGLMPVHIEQLKKLIAHEKINKGIIITDHLYRHTMELADELYLLSEGSSYRIKDREELVRRGYLVNRQE